MLPNTYILIIAISLLILIYIWANYQQGSVSERLAKGGKKTRLERILFWDPPWAFSYATLEKLEARSRWWKALTTPIRAIKWIDWGAGKLNSTGFFFILPFLVIAILVIWLVQTY